MPAILAELGFIDAKGEGEKLATDQNGDNVQQKLFTQVF